jgi:hypothetical protein
MAKRRRRRHTRLLTAAAACLVVVVCLTVAAFVTGDRTDHAVPPAVQPTASATPTPSTDRHAFEPATDRLTVGWFPAGLRYRVTESAVDELTITAQPGVQPTTYARVEVAPAGRKVPFDRGVGGATALTLPGRQIAGTRLYRLSDGSYQLRWQWAPGAPAILTMSKGLGRSDPAAAQTALRIQAATRAVHDSPVRSPIALIRPAGIPVRVITQGRPRNADVTVITMDFGLDRNQPWAQVILFLKPDTLARQIPWNVTLNAHRALIGPTGATIMVDLSPAIVSVKCLPPRLTADRIARCRALAASARLVADPKKPSSWPALAVQ